MPFFSIIIPVYNVAPYLRECLDSVLAQTFAGWEAICVDDGSTDASGAILDEYAATDWRIKVVHQKNAGVSAARNAALDLAEGGYICFLDADDCLPRWTLEFVGFVASSNKPDWIRVNICDWNDLMPCPALEYPSNREVRLYNDNVPATGWQLIANCGLPFVNYYRRKAISGVRFPVGVRFREDAVFAFEVAAHMKTICVSDAMCYVRRLRAGSAMSSPQFRDDSIRVLSAYSELWDRLLSKYGKNFITENILGSSTLWVAKDVRRWLVNCPSWTRSDTKKVYRIVNRLKDQGVVSFTLASPIKLRIGWWGYLLTGMSWILCANRNKLLGRPMRKR